MITTPYELARLLILCCSILTPSMSKWPTEYYRISTDVPCKDQYKYKSTGKWGLGRSHPGKSPLTMPPWPEAFVMEAPTLTNRGEPEGLAWASAISAAGFYCVREYWFTLAWSLSYNSMRINVFKYQFLNFHTHWLRSCGCPHALRSISALFAHLWFREYTKKRDWIETLQTEG